MTVSLYLACSILIGGIVFVDGLILLRQNGRIDGNKMLILTTTIEFIWVMVSFYSLLYLNFMSWYAFIPLVYILYNIVGWGLGIMIVSEMENPDDAMRSMVVPVWFVHLGIGFGLVFALISNFALANIVY